MDRGTAQWITPAIPNASERLDTLPTEGLAFPHVSVYGQLSLEAYRDQTSCGVAAFTEAQVTQKLARARTFPPLQNRLLGYTIGTSVEERIYMGSME
jgi:hypothetical protein